MSLQSANYPNFYLRRHADKLVLEEASADDTQFQADATFIAHVGLSRSSKNHFSISFESSSRSGYFIKHADFVVLMGRFEDTDEFRRSASWVPVEDRSEYGNILFCKRNNFGQASVFLILVSFFLPLILRLGLV